MCGVIVRPATQEDAASLAALHVASWRAAYRGLMPQRVLDGLSVEARERAWSERLTRPETPEARTWVAVDDDDGALLGFASTGPTRDADLDPRSTAEVYALYVAPERIGQGAGRALLEHAVTDVRARGWRELVLWALEGNLRAERFYARAGLAQGKHEVKVVDGADLPHVRWSRSLS